MQTLSDQTALRTVRARFSSLRTDFAFLDGPGGSQVPDEVGDAIARAMREASANLGAGYATSRQVGETLEVAEANAARFLGCEPYEITFGANMTSLNFMLTRTAARSMEAGDEVITTALDHDAGVAPWLELAKDRGLVVKHVDLNPDTTVDLDHLRSLLTDRTRVVAFAWASNAIGTVTDAAAVCRIAHDAGALAWIDAVHYAAHERIDVRGVDADVLLCSPYKFCGPHMGVAYVRAAVARTWRPYKTRPTPIDPVGRGFATGTFPFELLAGFNATIDYLDSIGGPEVISPYERTLGERFLNGLPGSVTLYGLPMMEGRVPTFLVNVDGVEATDLAAHLVSNGIAVWAGDTWYALELYKRLGYERAAVRIGFLHYNTADEVDRVLAGLESASA